MSGCKSDSETCEETEEQTACFSCIETCSYTYEASMLSCLQAMEDTTSRATVDDTMDDCSENATYTMNVCSETCYSEDVYHGWTPATEEGLSDGATVTTAVPNYRSGVSIEEFAAFTGSVDYSQGIPSYTTPAGKSPAAKAMNMAASKPKPEELSKEGALSVGGIVGVSGLVATVMLSLGLLTVSRLKAESAVDGSSV